MDSEDLRTFLAVHATGGFSRAAEVLHRTQPAISRRIALLEEELGLPLFERAAGGVVLSQAGRVLLPQAERALAAMQDCAAALATLRSGTAGPLAVAAVGTLAGSDLTATLKRFAADRPDVALTLRTATSDAVSDLVRRGEADVGLRYHRERAGDLDAVALKSERLRVVCAAEHPRAGTRPKTLASLKDEHWLRFPDAPEMQETNNLFAQFLVRGVARIGWSAVDSLTAQKRLVEAGFGIALLPESAIAEELAAGSLAVIDVADLDAATPVVLVTRRGGYLSPAARALIALLQNPPARARRRGM